MMNIDSFIFDTGMLFDMPLHAHTSRHSSLFLVCAMLSCWKSVRFCFCLEEGKRIKRGFL